MKHTATPGKYYSHYTDETWEQAVAAHSTGFDSIEEAVEYEQVSGSLNPFVIKNHLGFQVWPKTEVAREEVVKVLSEIMDCSVDGSMVVVSLMTNWAQVAAFPEKYTKEQYATLWTAFRQLSERGYL